LYFKKKVNKVKYDLFEINSEKRKELWKRAWFLFDLYLKVGAEISHM